MTREEEIKKIMHFFNNEIKKEDAERYLEYYGSYKTLKRCIEEECEAEMQYELEANGMI